ncbi:putative phage related protein [Wolbachia endosymbiont wPip_Mol of Culex molestus]|uniref:AAA family ATPase n=1 Tax=Wolbachia endosymbiont of Culex molestus TaxID=329647 RepID=UPI0003085551|nr:AAA family ATPase [Wolbachia endosymbiont of Culex molestus]CQD11094.1 putative phage related protein [Wolbachia endosymbiont wPip_Mol of Culex molestus]
MSVSYNVPEIKAQLLLNLRSCLSYLFPNGTFHGDEFRVGNIHGNKGQSLRVALTGGKAGLWQDFATGQKGDVLDIWAGAQGKDTKRDFCEVMASISECLGYNKKCAKGDEDFEKFITHSWNYYDENGQVIVKVYRSDPPGKKKVYKPFDVKRGIYGAPEIRPLYNIPGILKSDKVVLVEGEKCAEALIEKGITATTIMSGANADVKKTDWSQLKGKHIIIWPDNDEAGAKYAKNVGNKLLEIGVASLAVLEIPRGKPEKWDAADCVLEGTNIEEFLASTPRKNFEPTAPITKNSISFSGRHYLNDKSPMPEDIIAPRILTPSGLLVFAGAPKVGKSDFLISWLFHIAAGIPFLDMVPKRPLRVFYLQTEIGYHYMRERIQQLKLSEEIRELAGDNIMITPQIKLLLNDDGIEKVLNEIEDSFRLNAVDIIAIDPLRNIFDAGENGSENDNNAMLFFLQERVEKLRTLANPDAGVILVHHTKKIQKKSLEEDPFQSFSGAGSLRSFYTTGIIMFRPDEQQSNRQLICELRNGHAIPPKCIDKIDNCWHTIDHESRRLVNKDYGQKLDAERSRRHDIILQLIYEEAREKGKVYTINSFCQIFEGKAGLGSQHSIRNRIDVLAAKGYIKFNREGKNAARTKYGILCVEGMEKRVTNQLNKNVIVYEKILPTDYKSSESEDVVPEENPNIWVYNDQILDI